MKIFLTAVQPGLADAWQRHCGDLDVTQIHRGSIFELEVDAVVSPANSFGFMDGGIDRLYSNHFGWQVQTELREVIRRRHHGELIVGTAEIVETHDPQIPYLISAPTMRVPMILAQTVNPYLAARAALLLVRHGTFGAESQDGGEAVRSRVRSIAFPGLGTGVGRVEFDTCARQVRAAIDEVVLEKLTPPQSWAEAQAQHQLLYSDSVRDLQRG